jgi:hypothetical protein
VIEHRPQSHLHSAGFKPFGWTAIAFAGGLSLLVLLVVVSVACAASLIVEAVVIGPDPRASGRRSFGELTFLSGFELRSEDSRFGGLSGLALDASGERLYAVSDHGYALSAHLFHDTEGRLTRIGTWEIFPLLNPAGAAVRHWQRDAEALVRDQDGSFLVAFEQIHRLWRYPPSPTAFTSPPGPLPVPKELVQAPHNGGLEAMTRLQDGRLFLLTERFKHPDGSLKGWLMIQDQFAPIFYVPSEGFRPTDLATLGSGDVLLLERRFGPSMNPAMRIQRLRHVLVRPGARLKGEEVARFEPPLTVDNFEGLAVNKDPQVGTLLYVVSDDNYSPLQRTLLFQFRLQPVNGD